MYRFAPLALAIGCSLSLLSACSSNDSNNETAATNIDGSIFAAPVDGAEVRLLDLNGNLVAGPVNTDSQGYYSMNVADDVLNQELIILSNGGTFIDEATGNPANAGEMRAYAAADTLRTSNRISATPGSTIIANLITKHQQTLSQAEETFNQAFGYTPDNTLMPSVSTAQHSASSDESLLAGYQAATFSQLAMDLGLSQNDQFEMFSSLSDDLSDGLLDGRDANGPITMAASGYAFEADIQNRFSNAMINFQDSGYNQTGFTNDQIGNLPFSKFALTETYKLEYIQPGMMQAMEGKSTFQLHITDRVSGEDITGLSPMFMPMMNMPTMSHSTPTAEPAVTEDGNGLYTVSVYYLMASQMMDGTAMGYWDLSFTVAGEVAHFYPAVKMAMGDTVKTQLKGQSDLIKDMMGMDVSRDYYIFKDSLTGMGPYTLTLFVAAKENMMNFPAVINNTELTSGMGGTALNISSVEVNVSTNGALATAAIDNGDGTWSIEIDLNSGEANQLEVSLLVNGERKTSDGTADGMNATFMITPGNM